MHIYWYLYKIYNIWQIIACATKWKSLRRVQLCNPMGYTVYGILQARILEWVAFLSSRVSSHPSDWTQVSCIAGRFFTCWAWLNHTQVVHHFQNSLCEGWFVSIQTSFSFIISSANSQNWPCLGLNFAREDYVFLIWTAFDVLWFPACQFTSWFYDWPGFPHILVCPFKFPLMYFKTHKNSVLSSPILGFNFLSVNHFNQFLIFWPHHHNPSINNPVFLVSLIFLHLQIEFSNFFLVFFSALLYAASLIFSLLVLWSFLSSSFLSLKIRDENHHYLSVLLHLVV